MCKQRGGEAIVQRCEDNCRACISGYLRWCFSVGKTVDFLDMQFVVQVPSFKIEAAQEKTVTPLCATSCHSPSVHISWPNSVCNRIWSLSDSRQKALMCLYKRYVEANAHPAICSKIGAWKPKQQSVSNRGCAWLTKFIVVLRYHPHFRTLFSTALKRVPIPPELGINIMVAWRNSLPSMGGNINMLNTRLSKCSMG